MYLLAASNLYDKTRCSKDVLLPFIAGPWSWSWWSYDKTRCIKHELLPFITGPWSWSWRSPPPWRGAWPAPAGYVRCVAWNIIAGIIVFEIHVLCKTVNKSNFSNLCLRTAIITAEYRQLHQYILQFTNPLTGTVAHGLNDECDSEAAKNTIKSRVAEILKVEPVKVEVELPEPMTWVWTYIAIGYWKNVWSTFKEIRNEMRRWQQGWRSWNRSE
jgi:hypothetical protein